MKSLWLMPAAALLATVALGQSDSLEVGDVAPDFELRNQNGDPVRLSSFRGRKNVVLAFYVLAFTGG